MAEPSEQETALLQKLKHLEDIKESLDGRYKSILVAYNDLVTDRIFNELHLGRFMSLYPSEEWIIWFNERYFTQDKSFANTDVTLEDVTIADDDGEYYFTIRVKIREKDYHFSTWGVPMSVLETMLKERQDGVV